MPLSASPPSVATSSASLQRFSPISPHNIMSDSISHSSHSEGLGSGSGAQNLVTLGLLGVLHAPTPMRPFGFQASDSAAGDSENMYTLGSPLVVGPSQANSNSGAMAMEVQMDGIGLGVGYPFRELTGSPDLMREASLVLVDTRVGVEDAMDLAQSPLCGPLSLLPDLLSSPSDLVSVVGSAFSAHKSSTKRSPVPTGGVKQFSPMTTSVSKSTKPFDESCLFTPCLPAEYMLDDISTAMSPTDVFPPLPLTTVSMVTPMTMSYPFASPTTDKALFNAQLDARVEDMELRLDEEEARVERQLIDRERAARKKEEARCLAGDRAGNPRFEFPDHLPPTQHVMVLPMQFTRLQQALSDSARDAHGRVRTDQRTMENMAIVRAQQVTLEEKCKTGEQDRALKQEQMHYQALASPPSILSRATPSPTPVFVASACTTMNPAWPKQDHQTDALLAKMEAQWSAGLRDASPEDADLTAVAGGEDLVMDEVDVEAGVETPGSTKNKKDAGNSCHMCHRSKSFSELLFCCSDARDVLVKSAATRGVALRRCRKKLCRGCALELGPQVWSRNSAGRWDCFSCAGKCACPECERKKKTEATRLGASFSPKQVMIAVKSFSAKAPHRRLGSACSAYSAAGVSPSSASSSSTSSSLSASGFGFSSMADAYAVPYHGHNGSRSVPQATRQLGDARHLEMFGAFTPESSLAHMGNCSRSTGLLPNRSIALTHAADALRAATSSSIGKSRYESPATNARSISLGVHAHAAVHSHGVSPYTSPSTHARHLRRTHSFGTSPAPGVLTAEDDATLTLTRDSSACSSGASTPTNGGVFVVGASAGPSTMNSTNVSASTSRRNSPLPLPLPRAIIVKPHRSPSISVHSVSSISVASSVGSPDCRGLAAMDLAQTPEKVQTSFSLSANGEQVYYAHSLYSKAPRKSSSRASKDHRVYTNKPSPVIATIVCCGKPPPAVMSSSGSHAPHSPRSSMSMSVSNSSVSISAAAMAPSTTMLNTPMSPQTPNSSAGTSTIAASTYSYSYRNSDRTLAQAQAQAQQAEAHKPSRASATANVYAPLAVKVSAVSEAPLSPPTKMKTVITAAMLNAAANDMSPAQIQAQIDMLQAKLDQHTKKIFLAPVPLL